MRLSHPGWVGVKGGAAKQAGEAERSFTLDPTRPDDTVRMERRSSGGGGRPIPPGGTEWGSPANEVSGGGTEGQRYGEPGDDEVSSRCRTRVPEPYRSTCLW